MKATDDLGKLILRVTVGGLMLFHGIAKISNGVDGIGGALAAKGLPEFLKYGVYVGEVLAPALLIVGFMTRLSALAVAGTMAMAIFLAHSHEIFDVGGHGNWAIETPVFFLLTSLAVACLGAGRMSIDARPKGGS